MARGSSALAGPDVYGLGDGSDGAHVAVGSEVLGVASAVTGTANAGSSSANVAAGGSFSVGQLVVLHQTAGATAVSTFVQPPAPVSAATAQVGHFEYARITNINGNTLTFDAPLQNAYRVGAQVVGVLEYTSLTVGVGTQISTSSWNGSRGGILAISVRGVASIDGRVDVSGRGFRGAPQDVASGYDDSCNATDDNPSAGSTKGEGIAGLSGVGRGNRANAGGAGNCQNAGGGGGGNAGYGGVGGNGWSGDGGSPRGGFGGAAIDSANNTLLMMGGGGGAGDANQNIPPTVGAAGGGLILLRAASVTGSGTILAAGAIPIGNRDDGAGGGGAGGTVLLRTLGALTCGTVDVAGGRGGDVANGVIYPGDEHGPGGGGGGGRAILERSSGTCTGTATGGAAGRFNASTPWGAAAGAAGAVVIVAPVLMDADGDGVTVGPQSNAPDCDDGYSGVAPGAPEVCDGVDNDCDGNTDEGLSFGTYYRDLDGDGFGVLAQAVSACSAPNGYTAANGDCDDTSASVNPDAPTDLCDGADTDCDTFTDEDAVFLTWFADGDDDGHGSDVALLACAPPTGFAPADDDCNDADPEVSPSAAEVCNGQDDNCGGDIDEGLAVTAWYSDQDGDGFGASSSLVHACGAPGGHVAIAGDCDDGIVSVNPGVATDGCDGVDSDCAGGVDDDAVFSPWWRDLDGDGHGAGTSVSACAPPNGHTSSGDDCDDGNVSISPSGVEACNAVDDDCDGSVDEGLPVAWYADDDSDGFGDLFDVTAGCAQPPGAVADASDCDDDTNQVNPAAIEQCNDRDDDCDGVPDDGLPTGTWYADADLDGHGAPGLSVIDCAPPLGYDDDDDDCDDAVTAIHPGATEQCNLRDDDCDGMVDEGNPDAAIRYLDADGDGVGGAADTQEQCFPPTVAHVLDGGDCNDADPAASPWSLEVCGGGDEDCDGLVDDADPGVSDPTAWFVDGDQDGWGDGVPAVACTTPSGRVPATGDCDDADPALNPGTLEVCDGVDNDCDGSIDDADPDVIGTPWYVDADGDEVGGPVVDTSTCNGGVGLSLGTGDCDDADPDTLPGAPEPCAGVDRNCDGTVEGALLYPDADEDGFGDPMAGAWSCEGDGVAVGSDCNDGDPTVFPGAVELRDDGVDQDCNGEDASSLDTGSPIVTPTADTALQDQPVPPRATGCRCDAGSSPGALALFVFGLVALRRSRAGQTP